MINKKTISIICALSLLNLALVFAVLNKETKEEANNEKEIVAAAEGGTQYSECYYMSVWDNADCAAGYTAVLTSKGSGCQSGSISITGFSPSLFKITNPSSGSYRSEVLYAFDSGSWLEVARFDYCRDTIDQPSTVAICCK